MKVALVYDRINKWGGAERVLLSLHKIFPKAPIFTSVYNRKTALWAEEFDVKTSFLQKIPNAKTSHEILAPLMPIAFENFGFDDYDLVISVTSEAAKGIITKDKTLHICYCLTPTRYLWSGYEDYFKNSLLKNLSKPVVSYLRRWDKIASKRPDTFVSISREVKERIKKYYDRDSSLIHPPMTLIKKKTKNKAVFRKDKDFYLIVSRLVRYKKIDVAIKAFNYLKFPLKIVGIGSEENNLKKIAGPNIEFLGRLTDDELSFYYKNCKALIFPGIEDFGLVMTEAQSFGKPVIAYKGGGALDIIKEGITGEFFKEQSAFSLKKVLENVNNKRYNTKLLQLSAKKFSEGNFEKKLGRLIEKELIRHFKKL